LDIAIREYDRHFPDESAPDSKSSHSALKSRIGCLVGPQARYNLNFAKLSPLAQEAALEAGLTPVCRNPYQSIIIRGVEIVYACDEALQIIEEFEPPDKPAVAIEPRVSVGYGCTEGPRGILYHRYRLGERGAILDARIVPPTTQNLKSIEADLRQLVNANIDLPQEQLQWQCEQAIRNYGPCISFATHFLKLDIASTVATGR
jgi:coenzyme F420-reducing hydrogenase alpha subunit